MADRDPRKRALHSHPVSDLTGQEDKEAHVVTQVGGDALVIAQEETEESLDALITALEEEDGKQQDPEVLTVGSSEERPIPPELLETNPDQGLTDAEVIMSRKKYGWNRLKEEKRSHILKFLSFFNGPVPWVMEAAALLAAGLQDWVDFGVICGLLILNAIVGFLQEWQAGNIVEKLKKQLALKANVKRNGLMTEIASEEVVPGDIVHLEVGTIVPADGVIVTEGAHLQVDQSSITGESLSVDKMKDNNECFASSAVKRGSAFMVVTKTGDQTYVGRAARLVQQAAIGEGHFTQVLNAIGRVLLFLVVLTILAVWIAGFYRSNSIVQLLEFTLAITIIGVPVGLPAVVTTTLAVGASQLAKRNCIVQKLSAIESLAGAQVLCTDKTGTLTRNKLALGEPYILPGQNAEELMLTACLATTRKEKGIDAIDKVFIKGLKEYPMAKSQLCSFTEIEFCPFDPVSKKVTAVVQSLEDERIVCVKGAPLVVLKTAEEEHPLPEEVKTAYREKVTDFASRGFRALGVARKRDSNGWEILGIMPCSDPPRHDTAKTIKEAQRLGLKIKMLTGDAVGIARETARQLDLGTNIYDAERLGVTGGGDMPGSELNDFVEAADGFAEVYPQHKYRVVEILQQRGYLVAMTGDGVNDAPSLKKADCGIAVEGSSDAARSAADIVFLEPGLSAIIDAIKTSRQIFHRMYAYVVYRIALSIHLEIFFGFWMIIYDEALNLELVVLLAIFADIATLAIAYDKAPYSTSPVEWNLPKLWGLSIILGIILSAGTWLAFGTMLLHPEHGGLVQNFGNRDAVLFLQIALTQNWLILITRTSGSFLGSLPSLLLVGAVLFVDIVAAVCCIFGFFVGAQTSIVTAVRVLVFSLMVEVICAGVYYVLQTSTAFDNIMHGKSPRSRTRERSWEDFLVSLQRVAMQHEKTT